MRLRIRSVPTLEACVSLEISETRSASGRMLDWMYVAIGEDVGHLCAERQPTARSLLKTTSHNPWLARHIDETDRLCTLVKSAAERIPAGDRDLGIIVRGRRLSQHVSKRVFLPALPCA